MQSGAPARSLALSFACALAVGGACSDESEVPEDDDSYVTTGVTGANAATGTGSSPSTGAWGAGHQGGGGEGPVSHGPYPIVLAHGFFGFEEFAGLDFATYFYEVKEDLAQKGETLVFTPAVDPFNDSTFRGGQLVERIEAILADTGYDKVVIIGHSQGGLDARVVAHDRPDLVAAVVTVATPHGGTPVADIALGLVDDPTFGGVIDDLVNAIGAALYDQVGNETAVTKPLHLFSQPGITAFNAAYPDAPGVFYASLTGRTDSNLGGMGCVADFELPIVTALKQDKDPTDPFFVLTEGVIDGSGNDPNDGLVRVEDAKHGEFWGCVPADHLDEVGHLLGDGPGFGNDFDHKTLYREIIAELRARGF
ncbi:MAG: alpha/beta fold hydrolase [Polyangiaceae bacterium]|nr:alpha/beta fold hydrolase [Polyangiaceae bacterium]